MEEVKHTELFQNSLNFTQNATFLSGSGFGSGFRLTQILSHTCQCRVVKFTVSRRIKNMFLPY